jgi:ABC-type polysaccharide/polyol phosphate export permease
MHFGVTLNDLGNLTNIVMKMVFYLSGIFYNIKERLTGRAGYYLLRGNPVAFLMSELRNVCICGKDLYLSGIIFWALIGIGLTSLGVHLIHKYENSYAKVI